MNDAIFVDWISVWQVQPKHAAFNCGAVVTYDGAGEARFARYRPSRVRGSFETSCAVKSDGEVVVASGNFGRLNRPDNLFNFAPETTLERANSVLRFAGIPEFVSDYQRVDVDHWPSNASTLECNTEGVQGVSPRSYLHLSRVDITRNYQCGSLGAARDFVRSINGKNISRTKKGVGGDSSVWWANSRYMLKVYIKSLEMEAHGTNSGAAYEFARDHGIVRLELELKRREVNDLGWSDFSAFVKAWDMGEVVKLFNEYAKVLEVQSVASDAEFLDSLPPRLRVVAASFLDGREVKSLMSRATFFRYRKALLEYGLDISDERPSRITTHVRHVTVEPVQAPDWYWKAA